jgi:hypothetical protein
VDATVEMRRRDAKAWNTGARSCAENRIAHPLRGYAPVAQAMIQKMPLRTSRAVVLLASSVSVLWNWPRWQRARGERAAKPLGEVSCPSASPWSAPRCAVCHPDTSGKNQFAAQPKLVA